MTQHSFQDYITNITKSQNFVQVPRYPSHIRAKGNCDEFEGEGEIMFNVKTHIGEAFYALAVDGHLVLHALADHERLFEDTFEAHAAPVFGRDRVVYMSLKDEAGLTCTVVQYSETEGAFFKCLSVDGLRPR